MGSGGNDMAGFGTALALALGLGVTPIAAQAADVSVERGRQVSIVGGCNDCHTAGYNESGGKIDPDKALKGIAVGWQGPWGTTYAKNLRLTAERDEDAFVQYMEEFEALPPMPWYNVHAMDESDLRALYHYIKSLGDPGEQVPDAVPPGQEPTTPYVVAAPPTMPKG
jgi:mono/diheme cytochrome c family protein